MKLKTLRKMLVVIMLCAVALPAVLTAEGMQAYLLACPSGKSSIYTVGNCEVDIVKSGTSVMVRNTGTVPCYVRAVICVLGAENDGKAAFAGLPGNGWTDQSVSGNVESSGYYYYTSPLQPGASTSELFSSASENGAQLSNVCIYAEGVQSGDSGSYTGAWME